MGLEFEWGIFATDP